MDVTEDGLGEPEEFGDMPLSYASGNGVVYGDLYVLADYDAVIGRDVTLDKLLTVERPAHQPVGILHGDNAAGDGVAGERIALADLLNVRRDLVVQRGDGRALPVGLLRVVDELVRMTEARVLRRDLLPEIPAVARLELRIELGRLVLAADGAVLDRILGLEMGADDYIVKPFSPREVVSRIKAVLRRTCAAPDTAQEEKLTTLTFGSLEIQPERYSVKLAGQSIACTPREVELLYLLASHPGRVFDREQILSRIWGYDFFGDTRTVDTHIKRLRQKLSCDEMGQKWDIITVYGVGYKFEAEA